MATDNLAHYRVVLQASLLIFLATLSVSGADFLVSGCDAREEWQIRRSLELAQPKVLPEMVRCLDREAFRAAEKMFNAPPNRGEFAYGRRIYLNRSAFRSVGLRWLLTHALGHLEGDTRNELEAERLAEEMRRLELDYRELLAPILRRHMRDEELIEALLAEMNEAMLDYERLRTLPDCTGGNLD